MKKPENTIGKNAEVNTKKGDDKKPGEEKKDQKLTMDDLKGKKVDADPTKKADQPMERKHTK